LTPASGEKGEAKKDDDGNTHETVPDHCCRCCLARGCARQGGGGQSVKISEIDLRYSNRAKLGVNDEERTEAAIAGIIGKRLTYHQSNEA
jgi:hypothetical protein